MSVNEAELAICLKRGHKTRAGLLWQDGAWSRCTWCGLWLREIRAVEERRDDPPENEMSEWDKLKRREAEARQKARELLEDES